MTFDINVVVGVISALASVGGAVATYMTYVKTVELKVHDFRLQLKIADGTLRLAVEELPGLIARGKQSRQRINAATGMRASGASQIWEAAVVEDEAALAEIEALLPAHGLPYESFKLRELEGKLAATHALQLRADALKHKYEGEYAADDERRTRLADDQRAAFNTRLAAGLSSKNDSIR